MKRALLPLLFAVPAHAATPTPSQFLNLKIGEDRVLADYRQMMSYFNEVAKDSPRVKVEILGKTTLGEPMIMAVISSEANMKNLDPIKEVSRNLADPRGLTSAPIETLAHAGKTTPLVTSNIHSTEIPSSHIAIPRASTLA